MYLTGLTQLRELGLLHTRRRIKLKACCHSMVLNLVAASVISCSSDVWSRVVAHEAASRPVILQASKFVSTQGLSLAARGNPQHCLRYILSYMCYFGRDFFLVSKLLALFSCRSPAIESGNLQSNKFFSSSTTNVQVAP